MGAPVPRWAWLLTVPFLMAPAGIYALQGPSGTDAALAATGRQVFFAKGCTACHQLDGQGNAVACDLDRIGRRRNKAWLHLWLADPGAVRPGAAMPNPGLTHGEIMAVAEFLARRI